MSRPKVLYVVHGHPALIAGGAEVYSLELYEAMRTGGAYEPILLARCPAGPSTHPGTRLSTVGSDPLQYVLSTDPTEFDPFYLSSRAKDIVVDTYRGFLLAMQPDVVHFQHTLHLGIDLVRETRNILPHAPIFYTLHEFGAICHHQGQLVQTRDGSRCLEATPRRCSDCFPDIPGAEFHRRKRFVQSHFECVDRFLAPSHFLRQRFIEWGVAEEKILFEEYGRRGVSAAADGRGQAPRSRFGYFGQINPFKGVVVLLKAMDLLAKERVDASVNPRLWLHGVNLEIQAPTFQAEVGRLLSVAGDNVHVAGRYRSADLAALMANVDWVVVPSTWWENSPLVIQEAFAHGRPVICSDIGGMAEKVIDGVDGLHFRAGDPFSLAQTLARAASSPDLWDRLRRGIRAPYDMSGHVERLSGLYGDLAAQRRPATAAHAS